MIFGQSKLELKVGVFVFTGLVILTSFILSMKDFKNIAAGYELNFIFNFANGVKIGAPVRFAGVDVGEIKEINFVTTPDDPKPKVRIIGSVKKEIRVPVDSTVWVNTLGLLGEKYIEIMPGKDFGNTLTPKQALVGVDPIPMQEISVLAKDIAKHLDESLTRIINKEGTVGKLLYDDAIYKELDALITDIRKHPWKLFWKTKEKK
ncbi:MAG: MlaD family protein [Candidatus Omnitrophota bacterium]|nr:MlaD family protein [Candidatus Omnitrophota bacterium]